jgi:hypothetical protein
MLSNKHIEVVGSYVYVGVTFEACSGKFSMSQASKDRLVKGYVYLSLLERQCHQAYLQELRTKGWLFYSLVTPSLIVRSNNLVPRVVPTHMVAIGKISDCDVITKTPK